MLASCAGHPLQKKIAWPCLLRFSNSGNRLAIMRMSKSAGSPSRLRIGEWPLGISATSCGFSRGLRSVCRAGNAMRVRQTNMSRPDRRQKSVRPCGYDRSPPICDPVCQYGGPDLSSGRVLGWLGRPAQLAALEGRWLIFRLARPEEDGLGFDDSQRFAGKL